MVSLSIASTQSTIQIAPKNKLFLLICVLRLYKTHNRYKVITAEEIPIATVISSMGDACFPVVLFHDHIASRRYEFVKKARALYIYLQR